MRVVLEPSQRLPTYDPNKPDPRLVELVRMLGRQAAKDFIEAEAKCKAGKRLPE
ncbi:hypothetical protein MesoLjLb_12680 [Mesorhizobium sp. L-8-3]|nr:hypothetical protein MesoLjLb_12680 [Mesorhizobium sp. L-8-3]